MPKFYLTTAIDYANSTPHLGTAYEKIGTDVIARYRRMRGDDVYFLMGNDEHSQNVRRRAEELKLDPKAYCDQMAKEFQATWKELLISNDDFIQTSDPKHHAVVRDIANRIFKAKDEKGEGVIYKAPYEGYYCISCEAFYDEASLVNGVCPNHKTKPEWIKEENYFFRLSSFSKSLKDWFKKNPNFLQPQTRKNEVLHVLEKGLQDVSISRANKSWGIPLPFDENAVAYVWFDALINYISTFGSIGSEKYNRYWPADLHIIGKDITRFHCLIWPAMLMAAKLPLPKAVWAHGFVSISGEKMSKSRGNVADPRALAKQYGPEALRFHLMREVPWDQDGDFSEERLTLRYNADLANDFGNLVSRTLTMVQKYFGESFSKPSSFTMKDEIKKIQSLVDGYNDRMDQYNISGALEEAWKLVSDANLMITQTQPWVMMKEAANKNKVQEIFYVLLERIRLATYCLTPVLPEKMKEVQQLLGAEISKKAGDVSTYKLKTPSPLFPRIGNPKQV